MVLASFSSALQLLKNGGRGRDEAMDEAKELIINSSPKHPEIERVVFTHGGKIPPMTQYDDFCVIGGISGKYKFKITKINILSSLTHHH